MKFLSNILISFFYRTVSLFDKDYCLIIYSASKKRGGDNATVDVNVCTKTAVDASAVAFIGFMSILGRVNDDAIEEVGSCVKNEVNKYFAERERLILLRGNRLKSTRH